VTLTGNCMCQGETDGNCMIEGDTDRPAIACAKVTLTDNYPRPFVQTAEHIADFCLKRTIFHWDTVPLTARYMYQIHEMWCGKGNVSFPVHILGDTPVESFDLVDDFASEYNSESDDDLQANYE
jgi:hypothetical protein